MNAPILTPAGPPVGRESILLGPGTAVPVPYFDPRGAESESGGNALWTVLHAIRRRWFAIAVLGLVLSCTASAVTWYLVKSQFTAVVRFVVPARDESLVVEERRIGMDYALNKRTQQERLTGLDVLNTALLETDPAKMPELRDLTHEDRIKYLRACVTAISTPDSENMDLRVRCLDRRTAENLAEKISEVYLRTQDAAIRKRRESVDSLQKTLDKLQNEFREKHNELALQENLESPQTGPMSPADQARVRELNVYLAKREAVEKEIFDLEIELAALEQPTPDGTPAAELVSDEELDQAAEGVPEIQNLRQRIASLQQQRDAADSGSIGKNRELQLQKKGAQIAIAETRLASMMEQLRQSVEEQKRSTTTVVDSSGLERRLAVLRERLDELKKDEPPGASLVSAGGPDRTASIELLRVEVANLQTQMDRVQAQLNIAENAQLASIERQKEVGIRREGRVFVLDEEDARRKLIQSAGAGGAAFIGVSLAIVLFDLRRRRLNDTTDVSDQLQLNVLGTVPLLKGKGAKRLEQSARLAEAVDGVAATLLCRTAGEDHRVVMISSAMAGEGKTTLAANLATSLAAAGRRTLLVDFDLRRPMLHQVYQLPIGPGLGDLLSEHDLANYTEYLQETMTEGLWLITAGVKRQRAIAELADARVGELFEAFKEHFEFIIVDGPPVLPVVDTRLVARHADGVVISLLRDVSELPKVKSACQLLQSYRVRILGGVVIGASGDVYYGYPPERISHTA